ncbi:MAG: cytochrome c oxidase subunit 3 [Proteobacteria bacterium]|nr:cytochrome c oxidase subunit 3 [Pseudomonadota bacterium]
MSFFKNITNKSWERKGIIGGLKPEGAFDTSPEKVALSFFLVVATVVFSLFTVSYFIRMELPDWQPLTEPAQLWFNTGLLVASSILFQWARTIANSDSPRNIKTAFIGGGVLAILFIVGQLVTWGNLQDAGFYMTSNPANSFYYLLTGVHGIHLLGGLWVWSKSSIRLVSGSEPQEIKLSIELCTLYWHFLLVVWLVLFAILSNT